MKRCNTDIVSFINNYPSHLGTKDGNEWLVSDDDDENEKDDYNDNEEEYEEKRRKPVYVNVVDDFFHNDTIRNKKYPGEEEAEEESSLPYIKQYQEQRRQSDDKMTRLEILNNDLQYKFMRLIAGAMDVSVDDLIESDNITSVITNHNNHKTSNNNRLMDIEQREKIINQMESKLKSMGLEASDKRKFIKIKPKVDKLKVITGGYKFSESMENFFVLCFEYADYKIILDAFNEYKNLFNRDALIGVMERYFTYYGLQEEEGNHHTFLDLFTKNNYTDEDLKFICLYALWYKDCDNPKIRHSYDGSSDEVTKAFEQSLHKKITNCYNYIEVDKDRDEKILNSINSIEERIDLLTSYKEKAIQNKDIHLIAEHEVIQKTMKNEDLSSKSTMGKGYKSFIISIINARDDTLKINELIKGVNISTIHNDELNNKIRLLGSGINTTTIIDTTKKYFKDLYYRTNSIIDIYDDMVSSDKESLTPDNTEAILSVLNKNHEIMKDILNIYRENVIHPILTDIISDYTKQVTTSIDSILDTEVLNEYITGKNNDVYKSNVSHEEITGSIIRNTVFAEYYDKGVIHFNDQSIGKEMVLKEQQQQDDNVIDMFITENKGIIGTKEITNDIYLCKLFEDLVVFIPLYNKNIQNKIDKQEKIIANARSKMLNLLESGGEYDDDSDTNRKMISSSYNLSKPINSGIIQYIPVVTDKIDEAYNLVKDYCPRLNNHGNPLPLNAIIYSKSARDSGLTGDFARYVAILTADVKLLFKDSYKSKADQEKVTMKKIEAMNRLKKYTFIKRGVYNRNRDKNSEYDCYIVSKESNNNYNIKIRHIL